MTPEDIAGDQNEWLECLVCWGQPGDDFVATDEQVMRRHIYNDHELNEVIDTCVERT